VLASVLNRVREYGHEKIHMVVCDLSASPYVDLGGARALHRLHDELAPHGIKLRIIGAHGRVRDVLRADGIAENVGNLDRAVTLDSLLGTSGAQERA
jgi:MFS superfamily sulfate permease-like transporter